MKSCFTLLLSLALMGTPLLFSEEQPIILEHSVSAETNMEHSIQHCRLVVQQLSHNNLAVLNQFDVFLNHLTQAYENGEGLIQKDIIRIIDAIEFAAEKHRFQVRKNPDQTPYVIHVIGVADNLIAIGKVREADIIIGGLLHDTVEDTQTTFEEIEKRFGQHVASFVNEVTDDKSLPKEERKQLQIEHAPDKSAGAAQIKLADKLYNLTDLFNNPPSDWEKERVDQYFRWAKSVVDHLPWVNASLKNSVDSIIAAYWNAQ